MATIAKTFSELPIEWQQSLRESKPAYVSERINSIREVLVYNEAGTRYFHAWREYKGSRYGEYGNPSHWRIRYGAVQFTWSRDPLGGIEYEWCRGYEYGSVKGVVIPSHVDSKKDVMRVLNKLIDEGIFKNFNN